MTRLLRELEWSYLLAVLGLLTISVLALEGVSAGHASRQLVWIGVGLTALLLTLLVGYRSWGEWAWAIYLANGLGIIAVLVAGQRVHGSRSWFDLGPLKVQPSEFMKIATVLLLARVLAASREERASMPRLFKMGLVVGVPMLLIALQPDFGTALTFAALLGASLFVVGLPRAAWIGLVISAIVGAALMWSFVLADYQRARIRTFLTPEIDPHSVGYQIIQSRIAIGSGGLVGKGFADGTQSQLDFLPEKHTDFIFAVVAEAWGAIGSIAVLALYAFLIVRGFRIALEARDSFGSHLVAGIMTILAVHAVVNFGMVIGVLPTIGIPLPLMSYGGSSIVTTLIGVGLVLNVRMRRIANG